MKVVFSDRAYTAIRAETWLRRGTETGGIFLGLLLLDVWYVVEAIDPGPNSVFTPVQFEYDQPYTQHLINKTASLYALRFGLIGLWHRHPGSFDEFSLTDDETNLKYSRLNDGCAISALVNVDPDFRLTVYLVRPSDDGTSVSYQGIPYEVGDDRFPEGFMNLRRYMFAEEDEDDEAVDV